MKFSDLLGKNLISLAHAKELGTIYNCTVDNKLTRIKQLATVDNDENEGYVQNKLINVGEDVLFTVNALADYEQKGILFPFRARVFDTDGKFLGKVSDFEFEKNQILEIFLAKDILIKSNEIVVASNDLVIVQGKRKIRAYTNKPKQSKTAILTSFTEVANTSTEPQKNTENNPKRLEITAIENEDQYIYDDYVASDEIETPISSETQVTAVERKGQSANITINNTDNSVLQPDNYRKESPRKLISGYQFLLGRKVIKNILQGGILLIPKDKTIDVDTVELARKYGKLVELTVSSVEK